MKIAICLQKTKCDHTAIARKMAQAQTLLEHQKQKTFPLADTGTIVTVSSNDFVSPVPFAYEQQNGNLLLITGIPIVPGGSIKKYLQEISRCDIHSAPGMLKQLDGVAAAFFWDKDAETLVFTTDMLGYQPLYLLEMKDKILISTELKGIAASGCVAVEMDLGSFGSFITFGNQTGSKTFLKGVRRAQAGSLFTFGAPNRRLTSEVIHEIQWSRRDIPFKDVDFDAVNDAINKNILAYKDYGYDAHLLLSGGFDSRQILSGLANLGIKTKILTLDHPDDPGDPDGTIARRAAARFDFDFQAVVPPKDHFSSAAYLDFVCMDEVDSPSLYLFATNIERFLSPAMHAVWEGVAMGIVLSCDSHPYDNFSEFMKHVPLQGSARWISAAKVFSPPVLEKMLEIFRADLKEELALFSDDAYGIQEYILRDRTRWRTSVRPYKVFANKLLAYTPGVSREFMNITLNIPPQYKKNAILRNEMFRRYHKKVADIPVGSSRFMYLPEEKWYHAFPLQRAKHTFIKSGRVRDILKRTGLMRDYYEDSRLVNAVLARVDENHPNLNTTSVMHLKQVGWKGYSRALLFYWKIWHMIMTGEVKAFREELFRTKTASAGREQA